MTLLTPTIEDQPDGLRMWRALLQGFGDGDAQLFGAKRLEQSQ